MNPKKVMLVSGVIQLSVGVACRLPLGIRLGADKDNNYNMKSDEQHIDGS